MAKSDTWPGGVAMEALSNMDSAGSCDSVISVNSGYSEDSMEHLSAEERACLMYLEETIEALEVQEDSGLSNDEPDSLLQAEQMGQMRANDISSFKSDESGGDQRSDRADQLNQTSEPQSPQASAANTTDLKTPVNLVTPVSESVPGCEMHPPATQPDVLCLSKDEDGNLKIVSSGSLCADQPTMDSEIDPGLIPPPSDFMDEPRPPPQPLKAKDLLSSTGISNKPTGATIDLELLRQRASMKKALVIPSVTEQPVNKTSELSPVAVCVGAQMSPPPEAIEPRSPPAVAPKPKKLPANIILKSHKPAVADGSSGHSVPTAGSDRLLMDPQKIRMEALRKLGLLKSEEAASGPALSPKLSPKTRKSWGAPPSPVLSAAPQTPPTTPFSTHHSSPSPLESPSVVLPSAAPAVEELPDILPAPAAFSDPDGPLLSENNPSVKDVSDHTVNAQADTPPRTPPALLKLTPPRGKSVKSATLERSGLGLSSYMASQNSHEASQGVGSNQSPSQLRNNRPRPASLGSGKEFSSAQGERSPLARPISREPDSRRTLPAVQHPDNSQKLPRSQGISVLICPRAENGDNRREALKRLGLLRD